MDQIVIQINSFNFHIFLSLIPSLLYPDADAVYHDQSKNWLFNVFNDISFSLNLQHTNIHRFDIDAFLSCTSNVSKIFYSFNKAVNKASVFVEMRKKEKIMMEYKYGDVHAVHSTEHCFAIIRANAAKRHTYILCMSL